MLKKYDLTIHHTDRAVKALYDVINKYSDNYTVIYTSDHGEIVNVGHGIGDNVDQFLIPFMFMSTNPRYNCQYIESFRGETGYLSELMNKYILSNLLGYEIDQAILEKEKNNDRVLMPNRAVRPFSEILNKH
ncbi:sulfatase-like hydrolase/transferase [Gilliamella sp. Pas-s27]|uniref:sulfatase-like hydrolase/transferase n=1 Tax=Gilliamella sp. Pas-s27 TaxID=2687311 RepID=UPI00136649AB|nr:sulfatase-like hydrolase/transferase [Gilliamella sp. Pas-s27]MWP46325.1 sulfatase-like hydrolase/transferase [Gilliamella sp. Pas-s27]